MTAAGQAKSVVVGAAPTKMLADFAAVLHECIDAADTDVGSMLHPGSIVFSSTLAVRCERVGLMAS
jgi:hypothetical protein